MPWPPDPDMVECQVEWEEDENLGAGAQEWKGRGREKAWEKKVQEICPRGNNKVIIYFLIS